MKKHLHLFIALTFVVAGVCNLHAQGTAFTYHGRLNATGGPYTGDAEFQPTLWNAASSGAQVAANNPAQVIVAVTNGLFVLALDFGANFPGADRWLEIGVRTNGGGAFTPLTPRQPLTATPYAITAGNLSGALSGTSLSGTYSSPVTLNNVANNFAGSGANLTALNASQLASGTVSDARLSTNVALRAGGNAFTGNQTIADNLGIGTATPSQKLQIVGPENSAIDLATGPLTLRSSVNSAVGAGVGTVSSHDLTFFTGNLLRQIITADGKVGLNKNNPATALDVNGTVTATSFSGNGSGLASVNALTLGGWSSSSFWYIGGNEGTTAGTQFVGTTDNQPLEFKVNNQRGLRLEPTANLDTVNVIGGSTRNFVGAGVVGATIGGGGAGNFFGSGFTNRVEANFGTVSGGNQNTIQTGADSAIIGGGSGNTIEPNAPYATLGGGYLNTIQNSTPYATLGGGTGNTIQPNAWFATLGGGYLNTIQNNAYYATIPGGMANSAGSYAFAAGRRAKANHPGAFVWADSTDADFASTAANQFLIRAAGGVGINTNNPHGAALAVHGNVTVNGVITGNGAGLTNLSVASDKINFNGAVSWSGSFRPLPVATPWGLTANPHSVTAADVDGDGQLELVSANGSSANTLTVWAWMTWGIYRGSFFPVASLAVGSNPVSVTAADVNGDGKVDLISANMDASTLSVLINNGSGNFTLAASPVVGNQPMSVTAADVNGDGKVDLISANFGDHTLSVLTNNGSGNFTLAASPGVGGGPVSVTAADVNGDGQLDLISANLGFVPPFYGNTLSVLTNDGNGNFTLAASPVVGYRPFSVAAADVNGDGKVDLISADALQDTLSVLTNDGNGNFTLVDQPGVGSYPYSVTAADVNGDGKVDLISANRDASTLSVLTNGGNGNFTLAASPDVGSSPTSVTAADVNGDGRLDLISANSGANALSVLVNGAAFDGTFSGDGAGLTGLNAANLTGGIVADARLSANVALRSGGNAFTGAQTIAGNLSFGSQTRQMLNLWGTQYGIGVQGYTMYSRADAGGGFAWYQGGVHDDGYAQPGAGGIELMHLVAGGLYVNGTVVLTSDRNVKQDFADVNSRAVLEKVAQLPIQTWAYKSDPGTKHLGPVAQDFYAAFAVGPDDKHITTVDESGVALAAIQGLNEKLEVRSQKSEVSIQKLQAENAELKQRLEKLERLMNQNDGGAR